MAALLPTIGVLRERVSFFARLDTATRPSGHRPTEYESAAYRTCWAEVVPVAGGLATEGGEARTGLTWRVRVRWEARNPLQGDLCVFNGKNLYVQRALDLQGRRRFIEITCSEGPPG